MNVASPEPMPRTAVIFYVQDFGVGRLPLLHELESAEELLYSGRAADILMLDGVPSELMEGMKGRSAEDVARFFVMWIHAGFDFEAAAWSGWLSLHRTLFPGDEEPEPGPDLEAASDLDSDTEVIAQRIVAEWRILH